VDGVIAESGDTLDGPRLASQLAWYVSLAEQGIIAPPTESTAADHHNLINNRQAAMWLGSLFALATTRARLGDDLGVASFPAVPGGASNPVTAGCALISAGTNHSQAAWTFLDYLSRQALFNTGIYPAAPARPSVAGSSQYWEQMEAETAAAVRHALEQGWYRRADMPELANVGDALLQALAGESTLVESLPTTIEIQPTAPPPPPGTAIAVATPRGASGPAADALVVEYFPNHGIHGSREAVVALASSFNESQARIHVRIVDRPPPFEGRFGPLEMAEVFDCFAHNGYIEPFARFYGHDELKQAIYSLSPLMVSEDAAFQNEYNSNWLALNQVDGELFALPGSVRPYIIQYNRGLLANMGLEPPGSDWTVDNFWNLAQAATRREDNRQIYGFVPNILWPSNLLLFVPGAEYPFDPNPPYRPALDTAAAFQALTWLARMAETGVMFPSDYFGAHQSWEYDRNQRDQQRNLIISGQAAMWVEWAGDGPQNIETGIAPFPETDLHATFGQFPDPSMLVISRRTPDPAGCWEWFKFLTAQLDAFNGVSMRNSIRDSSEWLDKVGRDTAVAYEIMISRPRLDVALPGVNYPYRYWWSDILHSVFTGEAPAAVLERFQLMAEGFHSCYMQADESNVAQARTCTQQADPDFWQQRALPTR
jgi:ABC-type glycerol-3-phosphate transport system substrate-binding protein